MSEQDTRILAEKLLGSAYARIDALKAELNIQREKSCWWPGHLDGTHMCEGCGTVLHHGGHCDCSWNRSIVSVREDRL